MKLITQPSVWLMSYPELHAEQLHGFLAEEINGKWMIENDTKPAEDLPEIAGRLCYMSFDAPRPGGNKAYMDRIKQEGHGSVLEHSNFSILLTGVSRSLTHELVRHRAGFAYSQLSQRYVDSSDVAFIIPPEMAAEVAAATEYVERHGGNSVNNVAQGLVPRPEDRRTFIGLIWLYANQVAQHDYAETVEYLVERMTAERLVNFAAQIGRMVDMAIAEGKTRESVLEGLKAYKIEPGTTDPANNAIVNYYGWAVPVPPMTRDEKTNIRKAARGTARSVLPNCTETKILVTANARAWRHFIEMRGGPKAEIEIRRVAYAVWQILNVAAPNIFSDYNWHMSESGEPLEVMTSFRKV